MNYSKELPSSYKNWVHFYDAIVNLNIQADYVVVPVNEGYMGYSEKFYEINFVCKKALDEILSQRMSKDTIMGLFRETKYLLAGSNPNLRDGILEELETAKSILLRQAKRH